MVEFHVLAKWERLSTIKNYTNAITMITTIKSQLEIFICQTVSASSSPYFDCLFNAKFEFAARDRKKNQQIVEKSTRRRNTLTQKKGNLIETIDLRFNDRVKSADYHINLY